MSGIAFIVSAPSGAGKTTLCKMAEGRFPDIKNSVSYTTRPSRPGESNGVDYWFVDDATFDRMVERGEFLEYADVYGKRYGTSKKDLEAFLARGESVILEIDVQGAANVRKRLSGGVFVFILPPSLKVAGERLVARGKDSAEEIKRRLGIAVDEIKRAFEYDYIVINDDLTRAFEEFSAIIVAERARSSRMAGKLKELFGKQTR
ncbi:MAG TPA: guanylate kinase [Deltaproteobacteria bacterium]|nr:MAG: guanylate kinase [Deltaproteobacteria bacterium GWA2_55_82]OGQ64325.1 MAG: guanylate kinase [Deltaproteobacteria bacterium RIFCSPLOWO2_02_FULL_55_12]OIJ74329.1 MAG: guanylate kinase [Deltaproteobacteria bacterium GWC2_55_46]HBG46971.1 guanylate kinase [Deltaproteobacteria bacterium]HCY10971.1 guanylate kinase [Deltaproteobacteria bacterium]